MESPHEAPHFRWVRRPSEEALLGLRPTVPRQDGVRVLAHQEHAPSAAPTTMPPAPPRESSGRRLRGRDVLTVAAVAAAVWLALDGVGTGRPFGSGGADAPEAVGTVSAGVAVDRDELLSLPREAASGKSGPGSAGRADGGSSPRQGSSGAEHDPKPAPPPADEPSEPPLAEATIPGVGSVTVEEPDLPLPEDGLPVPDLDTGDLLGVTSTVALP